MKFFQVAFSGFSICVMLGSCIPASRPFPYISADNVIIKVGQMTKVRLSVRNENIYCCNENLDILAEGFFYSPNPNAPRTPSSGMELGPYIPSNEEFTAESNPDFFPLDAKVEIVSASTTSPNVPQRIKVVKGAQTSQVVLEIKGRSPGQLVITGGFISYAIQYPKRFLRTAMATELDPRITIEVVP